MIDDKIDKFQPFILYIYPVHFITKSWWEDGHQSSTSVTNLLLKIIPLKNDDLVASQTVQNLLFWHIVDGPFMSCSIAQLTNNWQDCILRAPWATKKCVYILKITISRVVLKDKSALSPNISYLRIKLLLSLCEEYCLISHVVGFIWFSIGPLSIEKEGKIATL